MKKIKGQLLLVISVLVLVLSACSSENNGFHEDIKDMDTAMTIDQEKEYLLYIYATSCAYCAKFKPTLNKYMEQEDALPVYAYDIDVESNIPFVQYFVDLGIEVPATPTLAYIKDGSLYALNAGVLELDEIHTKGSYKKILEQVKNGEQVKGSNLLEYGKEKEEAEKTEDENTETEESKENTEK